MPWKKSFYSAKERKGIEIFVTVLRKFPSKHTDIDVSTVITTFSRAFPLMTTRWMKLPFVIA